MLTPVVVCGTFHRDSAGLQRLVRELEAMHCRILSPISIDFADPDAAFVRSEHDTGLSDDEIQRFHLRALREAQQVWLHAPEGHVGVSGAFELGFAAALGIPVYGFDAPAEPVVRARVRVVRSVFEAMERTVA